MKKTKLGSAFGAWKDVATRPASAPPTPHPAPPSGLEAGQPRASPGGPGPVAPSAPPVVPLQGRGWVDSSFRLWRSRMSASGTASCPVPKGPPGPRNEQTRERWRRGAARSQASPAHRTPGPEDALPGAPGPGPRPARPAPRALGGAEAAGVAAQGQALHRPRPPSPAAGCAGRGREPEDASGSNPRTN